MSDYLIGDVQGCFDSLQKLLKEIKFSTEKDHLFFLGDIVNRGNKSLDTLRFIKDLASNGKASMVLGNHDFHLLACSIGGKNPNKKDTFADVINAKDSDDLLDFLREQPLAIKHKDALIVHAGIPPKWDADMVLKRSGVVEKYLKSDNISSFLTSMYDDNPNYWNDDLNELDKCRYTINALMRMRFCKSNGELEFKHKMDYLQAPDGYKAWFAHKNRNLKDVDIFFGHWSTLSKINVKHIYPVDHGCIWGGSLSAIRLKDKKIFSVKC